MADPVQTTYDEMPYVNKAFPQTHPDRLATIARIFGLAPPDIETARVLELGCASGDNLIPLAIELPNARLVGIDLSARQTEQGRQTVAALALTNIDIRQQDIALVDASWGKFDYILCHGIYSWVPAPIREKLLTICRENLAPNGVAYVSYNTLPGWHVRGMVREMMLYHVNPIQGATNKVQQSRALLEFLAQSVPATTPFGMALAEERKELQSHPDAYVFHDYLEEVNDPIYFHQFAEAARRHGLEYLGEADFGDMLPTRFPAKVAEVLIRLGAEVTRMEQYIDFACNRLFRQTLLVHRGAPLRRNVDGEILKGMLVATSAKAESAQPVLAHGVSEMFRMPSGTTHRITDAHSKAALVLLAKEWPLCMPFEELAARCRAIAEPRVDASAPLSANDERLFGQRMLQGYAVRAVELRVAQPRLAVRPSARPVASPLARLQALSGAIVTNLRHEPVNLVELPRRMLPLLDGTRDLDAVVAAIVQLARDGKIGVRAQDDGPLLTDPVALEKVLRHRVEDSLPDLARDALLLE